MKNFVAALIALVCHGAQAMQEDFAYLESNSNQKLPFEVVQIYRRTDPSFVQGLYFDIPRQQLVESTGLYGQSYTQWLDIDEEAGIISPSDTVVKYDPAQFGEGISKLDEDTWIELTWQEKVVNILDKNTLETVRSIPQWNGVKQGWGITLDEDKRILYVSDGSSTITRVNADTLEEISQFTVRDTNMRKKKLINELEFVDGYIWANVFYLNGMIKIDPSTGYIKETIDFTAL